MRTCCSNADPFQWAHAPLKILACLALTGFLPFSGGHGLLAHEPLFMESHEAPGKGAFDVHLEVTGERTEDEDETEYEAEATWGLTRDFAVQVKLPYVADQSAFGDPEVGLKWRFWDRDLLGAKYAVAAILRSTIPVREEEIGRDRPTFLVGLAHGREGIRHYYFVDVRYAHPVSDDGEAPGDTLFLDASYGWRPVMRRMDQTDTVFFFEANWEDRDPDRLDRVRVPASGGRFLSLAAEVLISPSNRLMIRAGVQVPVSQSVPAGAPRRDPGFRVATEFRF